jgi:hypothetical protein
MAAVHVFFRDACVSRFAADYTDITDGTDLILATAFANHAILDVF